MAVAVAVKKFNKIDLSYTCTLIFSPNYLTVGRVTWAHDYIGQSSSKRRQEVCDDAMFLN